MRSKYRCLSRCVALLVPVAVLSVAWCCGSVRAEASCLQNRIFKIYDLQTEVELWCMCSVNDSSTVTWYKYSINGSRQLIATGPPDEFKYTFILENASQGGLYQCECSANSCTGSCSQCFQLSVSLKVISFTIEPPIATVGSMVTFSCRAVGYPEPSKYKILKDGDHTVNLSNASTTGTTTVPAVVRLSGSYHCVVQNEEGSMWAVSDREIEPELIVYDPPRITGVRNFTADSSSILNATLKCEVDCNTAKCNVTWIKDDSVIKESPERYYISRKQDVNVTVSVLEIRNLTQRDFDSGRHVCMVGSEYRDSEDTKEVWLLRTSEDENDDECGLVWIIAVGTACAVLVLVTVLVLVVIVRVKVVKKSQKGQASPGSGKGASDSEIQSNDSPEDTLSHIDNIPHAQKGDSSPSHNPTLVATTRDRDSAETSSSNVYGVISKGPGIRQRNVGGALAVSDFPMVYTAVQSARAKWMDLGTELAIPRMELELLTSEHNKNRDPLAEMLQVWLKRRSPRPSWNSLVAALKHPTIGGESLAHDIEQKFIM